MAKGILITAEKDSQDGEITLVTEMEDYTCNFEYVGDPSQKKVKISIHMTVKQSELRDDITVEEMGRDQVFIHSEDLATIAIEEDSQSIHFSGSNQTIAPLSMTFGIMGSAGKVGGPGFSRELLKK